MTPVNRVHHTGVVVRSLEASYPFFRDALGLPLLKEAVMEDQGVRAALFDLGNSLLELLEPVQAGTGIARFLEKRGEGLHHVCLEVDDIRAALADLKSKDVPLVDEEPREGLVGTIAFLHPSALHGVLVELVDSPPAHFGSGSARVVNIRRLDHLVFAVEALQRAAGSWSRALGLRAEPASRPEGAHLELAALPVGDAFLELAGATQAGHPIARRIAGQGEGMLSISLRVDDLDAAVAELRSKGVTVSDPAPGLLPHTRVARIAPESAHGVALQLIERP